MKVRGVFWSFARRMLRHRALATGTLVFSVLSAGGLAAGLLAVGPMLEIILGGDPSANLRTAVESLVAERPALAPFVPAGLV